MTAPHPCLSPWKGALIGGLIGFTVGAISWTALPFHDMTLTALQGPAPEVAGVAGSGVFIAGEPGGTFLFLSRTEAGWGGMGVPMLLALAVQGLGGFFWTWILGKIPGLTGRDAALYGAMFGLCVGALGVMPNWVWWRFPLPFSLLYVVDLVVAWTIASPVIARWGRASVCELPQTGR